MIHVKYPVSWLLWLAVLAGPAVAQESFVSEVKFERVHLKDGSFIDGRLVSSDAKEIKLDLGSDTIAIPRELFVRIERIRIRLTSAVPQDQTAPKGKRRRDPARRRIGITVPSSTVVSRPAAPAVPGAARSKVDYALRRLRTNRKMKGVVKDVTDELVRAGREAGPYLQWLVEHKRKRIPMDQVCCAMVLLGGRESIDFVASLLDSKKTQDRRVAVRALARGTRKEILPHLVRALQDPRIAVHREAVGPLVSLANRLNLQEDTVHLLGRALRTAETKSGLAAALARLGGDEAHRLVEKLLKSSDVKDSVTAIRLLPAWNRPEDVPKLRSFLYNRRISLRKEACLALGKLKARSAAPDLIDLLEDRHEGLKSNAHWALRQISGLSLPADPELWTTWWERTRADEEE